MTMIFQRIHRLWRAVVGSGLTELEAHNAEAMLDVEREALRDQVGKYNQGLAGYASVIERLKAERGRLQKESAELEPKLRARLAADDRVSAGKLALRVEANGERLSALSLELGETERTYKELTRAREVALVSARDRIESLKRSIDECKVQEALADLTELAAGMHGSLGLTDGTLERVRDRVEDKKHLATGRARVARDSIDVAGVRAQEAEQDALCEAALQRFEGGVPESDPEKRAAAEPTLDLTHFPHARSV
jgi:phage shock protein A